MRQYSYLYSWGRVRLSYQMLMSHHLWRVRTRQTEALHQIQGLSPSLTSGMPQRAAAYLNLFMSTELAPISSSFDSKWSIPMRWLREWTQRQWSWLLLAWAYIVSPLHKILQVNSNSTCNVLLTSSDSLFENMFNTLGMNYLPGCLLNPERWLLSFE